MVSAVYTCSCSHKCHHPHHYDRHNHYNDHHGLDVGCVGPPDQRHNHHHHRNLFWNRLNKVLQVDCVEAQASDLSPSVSATCSQGFMRVRISWRWSWWWPWWPWWSSENITTTMIMMMTMMTMMILWEYHDDPGIDGDEGEDISQQNIGDKNEKPGEASNWWTFPRRDPFSLDLMVIMVIIDDHDDLVRISWWQWYRWWWQWGYQQRKMGDNNKKPGEATNWWTFPRRDPCKGLKR